MAFLIGGANSLTAAYDVDNSLRFNGPDDEHVSLALSSPNTDIFTISFWIKLGPADAYRNHPVIIHKALTGEAGDYTNFKLQWALDGGINFDAYDGVAGAFVLRWAATDDNAPMRLRDYAAWYHVVLRMDSSQGVTANRARIYINNSDISANFTHTTDPDQNDDYFTASGSTLYVGGVNASAGAEPFSGYIAEFAYVDGTSYAPSTFAEADADSGIWKPKDFKGSVTWGTNGVYLEFKGTGTSADASGMGADTSGEDNHMTVSNLTAVCQCTDTPTNNFAILNLLAQANGTYDRPTFSEGNCKVVSEAIATGYNSLSGISTFMPFYFEVKLTATQTSEDDERIGIADVGYSSGARTYSAMYRGDGNITATGESTDGSNQTWSDGDIIGVACDFTTNFQIKFYHNGSIQATMDVGSSYRSLLPMPEFRQFNVGTWEVNFGNPSYANSSDAADEDGYGAFEYAPPSGHYALCTKNLAEHG